MGPAVTKNFIPENTNGYYFKDFQDRQLRIIVLNCYENGGLYDEQSKWTRIEYNSSYPDIEFSHSYALGERVNIPGWTDYSYECNEPLTTPSGAPTEQSHDIPCWGGRRPDVVLYGHDQMQWFADTLLSTPANYSVVVALHSAFSGDVSIETEYKFCMSAEYSQDWVRQNGAIMPPGDAVADIVNAFIRGDNYSETIEYSTLAPYTVSCDFRGKNEGVKFSCFIGGHLHKDLIVRHTTYNKLFQVISSAALQNHYPNTDIAFMWDGANVRGNQTLVAVDDGAVCLMKIGYKLTDDGYLRDFEKITQNV
jgi:hypothetical protein